MSHARQPKPITSMTLLWAAAAAVTAYCLFARDLDSEPFFADESADIAQSFYYRLAATGQWNHVDWLHPAAYDHTPVFKYLIGFSLHRAGYQTPRSVRPWERWISGDFAAPDNPGILRAARIPMMIGAVFGCLMIFWLAWQLVGTTAGLLAAFLLAASPLYFTHARRAMADDLTQAFVLAGLVAFVALARGVEQTPRRWLRLGAIVLAGGLACGLAAATKLNGATAGLAIGLSTVAAVTGLLLNAERTRESVYRALCLLLGSLLMGLVAVAVFIGINPYFYARPQLPAAMPAGGAPLVVEGQPRTDQWLQGIRSLADQGVPDRLRYLLRHRTSGLQEARQRFPDYDLPMPWHRFWAILKEGMGRWTAAGHLPLSPTIVWLIPFVLVVPMAMRYAWLDGRAELREGLIPITWLLLAWPLVEVLMLAKTLTLDWDRYYMGVVVWTSLLIPYALAGHLRRLRDRLILTPASPEEDR